MNALIFQKEAFRLEIDKERRYILKALSAMNIVMYLIKILKIMFLFFCNNQISAPVTIE
jgi:hypothetical protein